MKVLDELRKGIETQNIEIFKELIWECPPNTECVMGGCPLYREDAGNFEGNEFEGEGLEHCLGGVAFGIYRSYYRGQIAKETALAMLICEALRILAFIANEEESKNV